MNAYKNLLREVAAIKEENEGLAIVLEKITGLLQEAGVDPRPIKFVIPGETRSALIEFKRSASYQGALTVGQFLRDAAEGLCDLIGVEVGDGIAAPAMEGVYVSTLSDALADESKSEKVRAFFAALGIEDISIEVYPNADGPNVDLTLFERETVEKPKGEEDVTV